MASEVSNETPPQAVTRREVFFHGDAGAGLFAVRAGVSVMHAETHCSIVLNFVRRRMEAAVANSEAIHPDDAWVCAMLLEQAEALRDAANSESRGV